MIFADWAFFIPFIITYFFMSLIVPSIVLWVLFSVISLIEIILTSVLLYSISKKILEIENIVKNIRDEAEKYDIEDYDDLKLRKLIKELDEAKEKDDEHKQLVLAVIITCVQIFDEKTKLDKQDRKFIWITAALQSVRWILQDIFEKERLSDQEAAKVSGAKDDEKALKVFFNAEDVKERKHKYYCPSLDEIITRPVPFDTTHGSKNTDAKEAIYGKSKVTTVMAGGGKLGHRVSALGHDPIFGWIFGTANILTSTITNNRFESWHVKTGENISEKASTIKIFEYTKKNLFDDGIEGWKRIFASVIKEAIHLKSDIHTKNSLPFPILSTIQINSGMMDESGEQIKRLIGSEWANKLSDIGIDAHNMKKWKDQFILSELINKVVSIVHVIAVYDESSGVDIKMFKVRTNKVIAIGDILSEVANVLYTGFRSAGVAAVAGLNPETAKEVARHLDVGGILNTIRTVFSMNKYIRQIKVEMVLHRHEELLKIASM